MENEIAFLNEVKAIRNELGNMNPWLKQIVIAMKEKK